ncbi:MAG: ATP-binding cassette domain-containing protein [Alphaproteobacteria bacterium]|nr:ATP-binding cassette domain-containing protein [Alphaproteobacteria bacterium]
MADALLDVRNLQKSYKQPEGVLNILHDVTFSIRKGEIVALVGPSGSGKSTLLHMVGLLDRPTGGEIFLNGHEAGQLNDKEKTLLRRQYLGFVYQFHYLQSEFSALENVIIPQMIAGTDKSKAEEKGREILAEVGLAHRYDHRPARLSGGEQQRVAIARALIKDPALLLADEPTGNLDPQTSDDVFNMLVKRVRQQGIGAVIATHNMDLAKRMDRVLTIQDGVLKAL